MLVCVEYLHVINELRDESDCSTLYLLVLLVGSLIHRRLGRALEIAGRPAGRGVPSFPRLAAPRMRRGPHSCTSPVFLFHFRAKKN